MKINKKKIIIISIIVVVVLLVSIVGFKIMKMKIEENRLLALRKYEKFEFTANDFLLEEENGDVFLAQAAEEAKIILTKLDEEYNIKKQSILKLGEDIRFPEYVEKDKTGYFMLLTNKHSREKAYMYAVKLDNELKEVWKTKIDLNSSMEELMKCIETEDGSKIFYMAHVNGSKATNNLVSIAPDGKIIINKPLTSVTTGSLVDLYYKENQIGIVVRSNIGSSNERHIVLSKHGQNIKDEVSEYKLAIDKEIKKTLASGTYAYGTKEKEGYIAKLDKDGKEVWKKTFERADETKIGEVLFVEKNPAGNLVTAYVEYDERKDFRKERMKDLYFKNEIHIINESNIEKTYSINLIKEYQMRYAPLKYGVDNGGNLYAYGSTSKYKNTIVKLNPSFNKIAKIDLDEWKIENFVTFSSTGEIYYADLHDDKINYTLRRHKAKKGEAAGLNIYGEQSLNIYNEN